MKCKYASCPNEVIQSGKTGPRRLFCNEKCTRKQAVADRRRRVKLMAVEYLGGCCKRCGWAEHPAGLVPHHTDPSKKEFAIGANGHCTAWAKVKVELEKCVLLCANCHAVVHTTNDPLWVYPG